MNCVNCGHELQPGQKFCPECGTPAAPAGCSNCGAALPTGAKFCAECGTPVAAGTAGAAGAGGSRTPGAGATDDGGTAGDAHGPGIGAAPVAERRLVSVLFCDLVGFTSASEGRDAEETRELLDGYFRLARERIERYGGTVEKFIGDAVMAVWGTPVAREDDAERAVRAAMDLVAAVGDLRAGAGTDGTLRARAGVTTGEAAVNLGAVGQGMVAGDIVNTAARLQSAAQPGEVLVDEPTRQAAGLAVAFEAAGEQALKGKSLPVAAWRALRVVAGRGGVGRADGLEPPFVGRDTELALLKDLFHATEREQRARLVSITGVAGIGKSRLAWEFEKYIDGIVEDVWWHQGRSPSYGEGITYWALGEMVRRRAGIAENDDAATTRERLRATLETFFADDEERRSVEPKLLALLGVEELGGVERGALFAAWRAFFERIAEHGPTVLVFEDLQWADPGLVDFVLELLSRARTRPILVVTLARPDLLERHPDWGAGQRNFVGLHLEALPDAAMRELLAGLVPGLPESAVRTILSRAEGVPLYAVETVRMLIADGSLAPIDDGRYSLTRSIDRLTVPQTLHALVAARLDGLDPADRSLLQDISVLGQSATLAAIAAVAGEEPDELAPRLERLARAELLRVEDDPRSPERGQYQFVQGVIREVAHSTLARKERKARHLAAARFYESLGDDELSGVLASHYLEAYRAAGEGPDADALGAQARVALRGAAERAAALHSSLQAMALFEQALTVTTDPHEVAVLSDRAADAAFAAGRLQRATDLFAGAIEGYRQVGDRTAAARAVASRAAAFIVGGRVAEARDHLEQELPSIEGLGDLEHALVQGQLVRAYWLGDEEEKALPLIEPVIAAAERAGDAQVTVDMIITKGSMLADSRPFETEALLHGAIALAASHGLVSEEVRARNNLGVRLQDDDPAAAAAIWKGALDVAIRSGLLGAAQGFAAAVATTELLVGRFDAALELMDAHEAEETEDAAQVDVLMTRAQVHLCRGEWQAVQAVVEQLDEVTQTISNPDYRAGASYVRGQAALLEGRFGQAVEEGLAGARMAEGVALYGAIVAGQAALWARDLRAAREAYELARRAPSRGRYVDALRRAIEAGIRALEGSGQEAATAFRESTRRLRDLRMVVDHVFVTVLWVRLLDADEPEAEAALREARETVARVGAERGLGAMLDRAVEMAGDVGAPGTGARADPRAAASARAGAERAG
ncbi:MAG TPA: AAA family ATPase [Candidatus Limnocylindrales bacterium]|nr:AAA family ATPase [Candidatus Limnocylindrales bacterium]